jgi:hypothetical protein
MSRSLVKNLGISLGLALCAISNPVSAAPQCITFAGLEHCSVDGANLAINQGVLTVSTPDQPGGVSIATPGATSWTGESRIRLENGVGDTLEASSISSGQVTSTAHAQRVANGFRLSATFTASSQAPTFTTLVYRNGTLQGSSTKNPSGSNAAMITGPVILAGWENLEWPDFVVAQGGSCTWTYRTVQGADRTITLPDGRSFVGDEIRFAEEVNPSGAYPYLTFDSLVFEGDLQVTKFLSETVQ